MCWRPSAFAVLLDDWSTMKISMIFSTEARYSTAGTYCTGTPSSSDRCLAIAARADRYVAENSRSGRTSCAAVELMFDNSQGRAAGQWSQYAEISVKRTLQRDGESNYYINGTHVRRRDITDMFLGTGLGPRAYAIIEQGMISRVIEARPEELRGFIEEAAGITKFRVRQRAADVGGGQQGDEHRRHQPAHHRDGAGVDVVRPRRQDRAVGVGAAPGGLCRLRGLEDPAVGVQGGGRPGRVVAGRDRHRVQAKVGRTGSSGRVPDVVPRICVADRAHHHLLVLLPPERGRA